MESKMRYRLALDIGTTSIGWCLIRQNTNDEPTAVIRMGVRIFSDGRNPKDGTSLAVTRRNARQMRRRRDRLLKRKTRLINALTTLGFFPQDPIQRQALVNLDPYQVRKKGLNHQLTGPEFARALFHINQRRGFLSNRKTDQKENESGALKKAIKELNKKIEDEQCQTLGEWLCKRHEARLSVRARLRGKTQKDKAYDFYVTRAMVEHEFDTLWAKQSQFNPHLFNENAFHHLKDILLHQRPLKPVKPGRCTLLSDEERAPLALPSAQRFRIYQEVNNIRFQRPDFSDETLNISQRNTIAQLLEKQGEVRFSAMTKALKLPNTTQYNLADIKRDRLKGNATSATLSKEQHFGEQWYAFSHAEQDNIVDQLLNEVSESNLIQWLQQHTGVDEVRAEAIANTNLPEGYCNLSRAALSRVVPELMQDVIVYAEAVKRAGFESHSLLSHMQQTGEIMEYLPYYGDPLRRHVAFAKDNPKNDEERFGKIANPTVHIALNEIRKVVNALIKRYGKPNEIILEVTRDLKLNRERKREIEREQKIRQDRNSEFVREACTIIDIDPANIDRSKRRELSQKMQLWTELNLKDCADRRCPYTGEPISIEMLLSSEVEVEHILPYSRTLDDSLNNKTVALRRANRDKGDATPYEAFGTQHITGYDYNDILARAALMPKEKAKRFAPDGYQRWLKEDKDFLARALNDTAYISRIAREYLSLVCLPNKVRAIPGRMTSLLRGKFGLNKLLSGSGEKNRDDHRHHALDAAVIGITDQGLLQRFAKASASTKAQQLDRLVEQMPLPWASYRAHVERALNNIIVSHKPDHGYQGAIHEETAWGPYNEQQISRKVRPEGGGSRERTTKNISPSLIPITGDIYQTRYGTNSTGDPNPYKYYLGGSNYCIEIYKDEKNKWQSEVISTHQAYQAVRQYGEIEAVKRLRHPMQTLSGKPLMMRLMSHDIVKMVVDSKSKFMRVANISGNGQIFFAEHLESNVDSRNRDKNNLFKYISKYAGSLQKTNARHVTVSAIGEVSEKHNK